MISLLKKKKSKRLLIHPELAEFYLSFGSWQKLFLTRNYLYNPCSLQDWGRNPRDPEEEGGKDKREGGTPEKAGAEHRSEDREKRRAQVIWLSNVLTFFCIHFLMRFMTNCVSFLSHRKKSLEGIKKKRAEAEEDSEVEDPGAQDGQGADAESDDEAEYYRQAVGEEPEEGDCS